MSQPMSGQPPAAERGANAPITRLLIGYNSADALRGVAAVAPRSLPTLVVDNASVDDTAVAAAELGYECLRLPANYGYGGAIMRGLAALDCELVLIANPDVQLDATALAELAAAAERYPEADLFVPAILKSDGTAFFRHESRFEPRVKRRVIPTGDACIRTLSGAAMLVRRASFLEHGFDPRIFLYFEDDDVGLAYAKVRRPIIYVPNAIVRHVGDASSAPSADLETIKGRSFGWSWGYVMRKHGLGEVRRAELSILLKLIGAALTGRRKRMRHQAHVLSGLRSFRAGERAPYLPADAGDP